MLKNVDSVQAIKWKDYLRSEDKAALFILERFYDVVDEWIEDNYPDGIDFMEMLNWIRRNIQDFVGTFPETWILLYENHLIDEEDIINMVDYGEERQVLKILEANPKLHKIVKQGLIESRKELENDPLFRSYLNFKHSN